MSICQYYLRGNCRYGNRCRFSHENLVEPHTFSQHGTSYRSRHPHPPFNQHYNYKASSFGHTSHNVENRYASQQQNSKYGHIFTWVAENFTDKEKALDILCELQREAKLWQKSIDFWRFTSRSLFPRGHLLEGWSDQSFEEIKWAHRQMTNENQEHIYKKAYSDYWENTERQLLRLAKLDLDTLKSLKSYINEYIASNHKPSKTLSTDIEMIDINNDKTSNSFSQIQTTNYTPHDQLLDEERAAFESDTFEFGQIPVHAPPQQFC